MYQTSRKFDRIFLTLLHYNTQVDRQSDLYTSFVLQIPFAKALNLKKYFMVPDESPCKLTLIVLMWRIG